MASKDDPTSPPIVACYSKKLSPILDKLDNIRRLNVTLEDIPILTIVVIGDRSSGKSSVIESLTGILLRHEQDICTRVPLIMRLKPHQDPVPEFCLEFKNKSIKIAAENKISEAIATATVEIAGNSSGISNVPVTLVVKKKGLLDLTLVDLPGITWVPVGDQSTDIHNQISGMIMKYIESNDSIILNVLSAKSDFTSCESICMSRLVDNTYQRTLAVVTNCDQYPDGLLEKVKTNAFITGLDYICVRNRIKDETYEEGQNQEATLFESHPLLSKIQKSNVGVPTLASSLVEIQWKIIAKCFLNMVKNIEERLNASVLELDQLPQSLTSVHDAVDAFILQTVRLFKEALQKIVLRGELDTYVDNKEMHCNAMLGKMLAKLSKDLQPSLMFSKNSFLVEEIQVLEEANGISLPNSLPHSVFLRLLNQKVNSVSHLLVNFVKETWGYVEIVCDRVLSDCCEKYPQLLPSMKKATQNVMAKMKVEFVDRVGEMIEMEKTTDFTCVPDFIASYNKLMGIRDEFFSLCPMPYQFEDFGTVTTSHLIDVPRNTSKEAFDLKMRFTAYWRIVLRRLVDNLILQLRYFMQKAVNNQLEKEIVKEVMENGGGVKKLLGEPQWVVKKRVNLESSIGLLKDSKKVIEQLLDVGINTL